MTAVFADAGYWIALWRPRDALYERAMTVAESLGAVTVVTTQLVLIEALDAMASGGEFSRRFAVQGHADAPHLDRREQGLRR